MIPQNNTRLTRTLLAIDDFLFATRISTSTVALQTRVTVLALYGITLASLVAGPYSILKDYDAGYTALAITTSVYLVILLGGVVLFWITRSLTLARISVTIAFLTLLTGITASQGGPRGLAFIYIISGYAALYNLLGFKVGLAVPSLVLLCFGIVLAADAYGPLSVFRDSELRVIYTMIMLVSTVLGTFSVLYQHLIIKKLYTAAYTDELTGLPGRNRLEQLIETQIRVSRVGAHAFSLIGVKISEFSRINSFHGSMYADMLIRELARRLNAEASPRHKVTRYTGTVFVVVVRSSDTQDVAELGRRLLDAAQAPYDIDGEHSFIQTSVTITRFPQDGREAQTLIANLMASFSRAGSSPGSLSFFDGRLFQVERRRHSVLEALHKAVENSEFELYLQPRLRLSDRACDGAELLLRWRNPVVGEVAPDIFIPLAEDAGLIGEITRWVLNSAGALITTLQAQLGADGRGFIYSINLSPLDLSGLEFMAAVHSMIERTKLPTSSIEFEITEGIMMDENPITHQNLDTLRNSGHRIAIDDFGIGYSSLSYLHRVRAHNLKIDRSFVQRINETHKVFPVVDAIISMAKSLQLDITAEGVETPYQEQYLRERGCDLGQGWLYARPMTSYDFIRWCKQHSAANMSVG